MAVYNARALLLYGFPPKLLDLVSIVSVKDMRNETELRVRREH